MKISARNRLKGKITEVKKGATTAHVKIKIGSTIVTAAITNEAVTELKLKKGQTVSRGCPYLRPPVKVIFRSSAM